MDSLFGLYVPVHESSGDKTTNDTLKFKVYSNDTKYLPLSNSATKYMCRYNLGNAPSTADIQFWVVSRGLQVGIIQLFKAVRLGDLGG